MPEPPNQSIDWLNLSGVISGWAAIIISMWGIKLTKGANRAIADLATQVTSFHRHESARVDQLINTIILELQRRR